VNDPLLRVALDVTPMLGPPTGVSQTTAGLLRALRNRHEVDVSGYVLSLRGVVPRDLLAGTKVVSRRWPAALVHRSWARSDLPRGRWVAGPCDVIHGTNYTTPPAPRGRVVSVQDLTMVTHPEWCTPQVTTMLGALRRAVERGAHVHVTSAASAEEAVAHLGVDTAHLHVIPVALTPVGSGDGERGRALAGADVYVLAIGTTEPRKGLTALPAALSRLDGAVRLVVAGPVGPAEEELAAAVAAAGIGDRYRRLGVVDEQARVDLLHGAAVLAYPSLEEGFGLPPLEALSIGCPVVASHVGALPELVGDHVELIPPGDDTALGEALQAAIEHRATVPAELVDRLAAMTWERAADQMIDVYRLAAG
jgi:glycosyltransferase involved in cell wall biosynthesis